MAIGLKDLRSLADRLQETRDELRVQAHLGRMEAHEEWRRMEERWRRVEPHLKRIRTVAGDSARLIGDAASEARAGVDAATRELVQTVLEEIERSYARLREEVQLPPE